MAEQSGTIPRGFPNLALVRAAIRLLVPRIKTGALPPPSPTFWKVQQTGYNDRFGDDRRNAQELARTVARHYSIEVRSVIVDFSTSLSVAAQVDLGPNDHCLIEINESYRRSTSDLGAILGHEIAHVFLKRAGLELPDSLANEILTDTTAALYGFGAVMAGAFQVYERRESVDGGTRITKVQRNLGYLTPDELGYVLARGGYWGVESHLSDERTKAARTAIRIGRRKALREIRTPPLQLASIGAKLGYRARRWVADKRPGSAVLDSTALYSVGFAEVIFRCPQCCQKLRVPTRRQLTVTCSNCDSVLPCET